MRLNPFSLFAGWIDRRVEHTLQVERDRAALRAKFERQMQGHQRAHGSPPQQFICVKLEGPGINLDPLNSSLTMPVDFARTLVAVLPRAIALADQTERVA